MSGSLADEFAVVLSHVLIANLPNKWWELRGEQVPCTPMSVQVKKVRLGLEAFQKGLKAFRILKDMAKDDPQTLEEREDLDDLGREIESVCAQVEKLSKTQHRDGNHGSNQDGDPFDLHAMLFEAVKETLGIEKGKKFATVFLAGTELSNADTGGPAHLAQNLWNVVHPPTLKPTAAATGTGKYHPVLGGDTNARCTVCVCWIRLNTVVHLNV